MFDKLKQAGDLMKMRSQAAKIQKALADVSHSEEKNNIKVVVNGNQEFTYIEIDGEERKEIRDILNDAIKGVQKKAAKKMLEVSGGLGGLFGNF